MRQSINFKSRYDLDISRLTTFIISSALQIRVTQTIAIFSFEFGKNKYMSWSIRKRAALILCDLNVYISYV